MSCTCSPSPIGSVVHQTLCHTQMASFGPTRTYLRLWTRISLSTSGHAWPSRLIRNVLLRTLNLQSGGHDSRRLVAIRTRNGIARAKRRRLSGIRHQVPALNAIQVHVRSCCSELRIYGLCPSPLSIKVGDAAARASRKIFVVLRAQH